MRNKQNIKNLAACFVLFWIFVNTFCMSTAWGSNGYNADIDYANDPYSGGYYGTAKKTEEKGNGRQNGQSDSANGGNGKGAGNGASGASGGVNGSGGGNGVGGSNGAGGPADRESWLSGAQNGSEANRNGEGKSDGRQPMIDSGTKPQSHSVEAIQGVGGDYRNFLEEAKKLCAQEQANATDGVEITCDKDILEEIAICIKNVRMDPEATDEEVERQCGHIASEDALFNKGKNKKEKDWFDSCMENETFAAIAEVMGWHSAMDVFKDIAIEVGSSAALALIAALTGGLGSVAFLTKLAKYGRIANKLRSSAKLRKIMGWGDKVINKMDNVASAERAAMRRVNRAFEGMGKAAVDTPTQAIKKLDRIEKNLEKAGMKGRLPFDDETKNAVNFLRNNNKVKEFNNAGKITNREKAAHRLEEYRHQKATGELNKGLTKKRDKMLKNYEKKEEKIYEQNGWKPAEELDKEQAKAMQKHVDNYLKELDKHKQAMSNEVKRHEKELQRLETQIKNRPKQEPQIRSLEETLRNKDANKVIRESGTYIEKFANSKKGMSLAMGTGAALPLAPKAGDLYRARNHQEKPFDEMTPEEQSKAQKKEDVKKQLRQNAEAQQELDKVGRETMMAGAQDRSIDPREVGEAIHEKRAQLEHEQNILEKRAEARGVFSEQRHDIATNPKGDMYDKYR